MLLDPGAIAEPMKDITEQPTRSDFRAWKVSEAEEITGATTAWTSERAFGTHVSRTGSLRSLPM